MLYCFSLDFLNSILQREPYGRPAGSVKKSTNQHEESECQGQWWHTWQKVLTIISFSATFAKPLFWKSFSSYKSNFLNICLDAFNQEPITSTKLFLEVRMFINSILLTFWPKIIWQVAQTLISGVLYCRIVLKVWFWRCSVLSRALI